MNAGGFALHPERRGYGAPSAGSKKVYADSPAPKVRKSPSGWRFNAGKLDLVIDTTGAGRQISAPEGSVSGRQGNGQRQQSGHRACAQGVLAEYLQHIKQ